MSDVDGGNSSMRPTIGKTIVLVVLSIVTFMTGHTGRWFDWWFIVIVIPMFLIGGGLELHAILKHKFRWTDDNSFVVGWMLPSVVGAGIFFAYVINWPEPPPKAELQMSLVTNDPDSHLMLTNEFLIVGLGEKGYSSTNCGFLLLPVINGESEITVGAFNTSRTLETESVQIFLGLPKGLKVAQENLPGDIWQEASQPGGREDFQHATIRVTHTLPPMIIKCLPTITIKNAKEFMRNPVEINLDFSGRGIPRTSMIFYLVFSDIPKQKPPRWIKPLWLIPLESNRVDAAFFITEEPLTELRR